MQTNIQEFFRAKKLPDWLVEHPAFKSIDKVDKIFPRIGLPNCTEQCTFENIESARTSAIALLTQLKQYINESDHRLCEKEWETKPNLVNLHLALSCLNAWLAKPHIFISKKGGKISINLPETIYGTDKKILFRCGEGFFRVYNRLAEELATLKRGAKLRKLEKVALFKAFSSVNIPTDKFSIVFSSDGTDGLWDIATMSMRGITSCQRWQGQYRHCLIGSIVDPFTAVIYLTSGTNYKQLGAKMIRRSVVRFVVNNLGKKPYILVDRVYPSYDEEAVKKFIEFITRKTGGRFDVVYGPNMNNELHQNSYIPKFNAGEILSKFPGSNLFSYQDTKVPIGKQQDKSERTRAANLRTRQINFFAKLNQTASTIKITHDVIALKDTKLEKESNEFKEFFVKAITSADFKYHIIEYVKKISDRVLKECPQFPTESPDDYTRRLCYFYFINKSKITKAEKTAFLRRMNVYYNKPKRNRTWHTDVDGRIVYDAIKPQFKFKSAHFGPVLEFVEKQISQTVKNYAIETMKKPDKQSNN